MFITRKYLSRRTVLRGLGAAIALPLLDAMIPAATALANTAASPPVRMGFFYFPHGAIMSAWTPTATGTDFELSRILKPLAAYQKQLTIVSGLGNKPGESAAVHAIGTKGKASVDVELADGRHVASVSTIGRPVPAVGSVIDVEYLYAYPNGGLVQPVYKSIRTDVGPDGPDKLQYKGEER